jgi:iron complex outermembrane receptor protein
MSIGQVQLGLRVDFADYTNRDFASFDDAAFSGAVGLTKRISQDYEFVTNLSLSERVPDIEELYSNGLHIATNQVEVGLLAQALPVEKEFAANLDVGIEKLAGRWRWTVRAFYTDYDDYTYQRISGEQDVDGELFPLALYRQDAAKFWGAEAEVSYDLVSNDDYTLIGKLLGDFVEAELNDGSDLPRIPPARFGGALEYARGALTTSLRALYHAQQDDISSFNTGAFTLVNLDAIYAFEAQSLDCELFIKGSNLLDEDARRSTSFVAAFSQLPGRNVEAGVRVMF